MSSAEILPSMLCVKTVHQYYIFFLVLLRMHNLVVNTRFIHLFLFLFFMCGVCKLLGKITTGLDARFMDRCKQKGIEGK